MAEEDHISRLKDSIISQLDPSLQTTDHSSFLQSRIQDLFKSFHTPTHPPYALMIRKAITELNDGSSGSTEEAISEFIRKEYEDLPWAHTKTLDFHLKKLCEEEELLFTEDGRYVLPVDDEKGAQQKCKRGRKRKTDHGNGERTGTVESVGIREQFQKESSIDFGQGSPEYMISTPGPGIEVSSPTQLQQQISSDIDLGGVSKTKASLPCVSVDDDDDDYELPQHYNQGNPEGNLNENPMPRRVKQKIPKGPRGRPRKTNTVVNSQEESSFNNQGSIANNTVKQGQGRPRKVNNDTEQSGEQSQPEDQAKPSGRGRCRGRARARGGGRGRGRGRGEGVSQDTEQCKEESHPEDQAKPHGGGEGECANQDTEHCKEQSHSEDQGGEGVDQDTEKCKEQSHSEDRGGEGIEQDTEQCEEQSHSKDQRGEGGGRGRGRGRSGSCGRGRSAVRKGLLK